MKTSLLAVMVTGSVLLTGCATIFTDAKDQEITIDSHQTGLSLYGFKMKYLCDLPCTLKPQNSGIFVVRGEGYKQKMIMIEQRRNPATYGQLTLGIGEVIDGITGSDIIYEPYTLVELERETNEL